MNVLVIDKKESSYGVIQKIKAIEKFDKRYTVFQSKNYDDGLKSYLFNKIEFVLVDFDEKENKKLLDEITKINPLQKVITISNKIDYSNDKGCEDCVKRLNRRRLLRTSNATELMKLMEEFDTTECKYFQSKDDIRSIASDILERFIGCEYDEKTGMITLSSNGVINIKNILSIRDILKTHNVKYEVISSENIQIILD